MANLVNMYLKKVSNNTDDPRLKGGIKSILRSFEEDENLPDFMKKKSSFKDVNKKMSKIEDENK